jgi:hypothetical protein
MATLARYKTPIFSASSFNKLIFSHTARPAISAKSQLGASPAGLLGITGFLFLF